ncbi:MAG: transcriptional repressor [Caldimicrobium sp.]|nr:transcriptional repressor [Caldimicrobium sp.]MCX7873429.1 transcriptional repressor [Caldimicrobium sp.]MDW8094407.1 Fur family transcriptional regulator [Caldimicrobium sp.]
MNELQKRLETYKRLGLKLTPQRLAILEYLENTREHPSAEDIYNALKDRFPSMSFATVYNTLEVLIEKGLVKELSIDSSKKRFDPFLHSHHHFICKQCGKIFDVERNFDILIPEELKEFEVSDFQVVFSGLCPTCKKK